MCQAPCHDIEAVILAGGQSKRFQIPADSELVRFGNDKSFIPFRGRKLIDFIVDMYARVFSRVTVLANKPIELENPIVRLVPDRIHYGSPSSMAGLINALLVTKAERVCVGACDMPFVQEDLLILLRDCRSDKDLLIPLMNHYLQPMPAVYQRSCIPVLQKQMQSGNYRILDFFSRISMDVLMEDQLREAGITEQTFFNMNTWADYMKVLAVPEEKT